MRLSDNREHYVNVKSGGSRTGNFFAEYLGAAHKVLWIEVPCYRAKSRAFHVKHAVLSVKRLVSIPQCTVTSGIRCALIKFCVQQCTAWMAPITSVIVKGVVPVLFHASEHQLFGQSPFLITPSGASRHPNAAHPSAARLPAYRIIQSAVAGASISGPRGLASRPPPYHHLGTPPSRHPLRFESCCVAMPAIRHIQSHSNKFSAEFLELSVRKRLSSRRSRPFEFSPAPRTRLLHGHLKPSS
jgi:hypothetical protein